MRLSARRDPDAARQVRRDLRDLLGRPALRALRPRPGRATASTTRSRAAGLRHGSTAGDHHAVRSRGAALSVPAEILDAARSRAPGARPAPQPGRRRHRHRQDRRRRPRLPRPARAARRLDRCCSSPTARRSSTSRCAPSARCWATARFGELSSAAPGPSGGSTSSPASSRCTPTASTTIAAGRTSTSWSSTSSTTPRPPTYRRLLDHLQPEELLGLTATPERADGLDVRALVRRPHRRRAAPVGRARARPARPVPLLRHRRRHRPAPASTGSGGAVRRRGADQRLHRQRRLGRRYPARACATRSRTRERCGPSASASASPTPSSWPTLQRRRHRRARGHPADTPAAERDAGPRAICATASVQRALHRRPVQRGRRRAGGRHRAVPAPDRERHGLPATARPRPAPRRARPC